ISRFRSHSAHTYWARWFACASPGSKLIETERTWLPPQVKSADFPRVLSRVVPARACCARRRSRARPASGTAFGPSRVQPRSFRRTDAPSNRGLQQPDEKPCADLGGIDFHAPDRRCYL